MWQQICPKDQKQEIHFAWSRLKQISAKIPQPDLKLQTILSIRKTKMNLHMLKQKDSFIRLP